jgi:hypothetical protein
LVEVKGVGLFGTIKESLDNLVVLVEDSESVPVLINAGILLVVLLFPISIEIND